MLPVSVTPVVKSRIGEIDFNDLPFGRNFSDHMFIADYIDGSAKRLVLYKIDEYSQPMRQLAEVIFKSAIEIKAAVGELKSLENKLRIREALVRINSLENHADDIFDGAIANLFEEEKDAIKIIKLKEILSNMETATDKCEDVANVIETILIKNS